MLKILGDAKLDFFWIFIPTSGKTEHDLFWPTNEMIWWSWADVALVQLSEVIPRGLKDWNITSFSLVNKSKI